MGDKNKYKTFKYTLHSKCKRKVMPDK